MANTVNNDNDNDLLVKFRVNDAHLWLIYCTVYAKRAKLTLKNKAHEAVGDDFSKSNNVNEVFFDNLS
jgi:ribonuclease HIII